MWRTDFDILQTVDMVEEKDGRCLLPETFRFTEVYSLECILDIRLTRMLYVDARSN